MVEQSAGTINNAQANPEALGTVALRVSDLKELAKNLIVVL